MSADTTTKNEIISFDIEGNQKLELEKAKLGYLDLADYKLVSDGIGLPIKNALSKMISSGALAANIGAKVPYGLYTTRINPSLLMQYKDNTLSSMVADAKGIATHSGFIPVTAAVFVPLVAFQIAAFVTGQYFLVGISRQLNQIREGIEELKELHHNEKEAKLDTAYTTLQEFASQGYATPEDLEKLNRVEMDLKDIFNEYKRLFEKIDPETVSYMRDFDFATSKVQKMRATIEKQEFDFKFNMVITADELLKMTKLVRLKLCILLQDGNENRRKQIASLYEEIKGWNEENFYRVQFENSDLSCYYDNILAKAKDVYRQQLVHHKKVDHAVSFFRERARVFESVQKSEIEVLKIARKLIASMEQPTKMVFEITEDKQVNLYVRNRPAA